MLLCLKSYATYFGSQKTFSPILTCRWKLPCSFKIKMLSLVSAQLQGTVILLHCRNGGRGFTSLLLWNPQGSNQSLVREEPFVCRPVSLFKGQCQVQVLWSALLQIHRGTNEEMKAAALIDRDFSVVWDLLPEPCSHVFWQLWFSTCIRLCLQHAEHKPMFLALAAMQCVCCATLLLSVLECWSKYCVGVGANIAKGSVPWLNDRGFAAGFVFLFFSCVVTASTRRETRSVLDQMYLSPIFGLCNALIIFLYCLANKSQSNHPLWLYIRFEADVSDKLFSEFRMG